MFSKSLDGDGCGKLRWLDANSGAHGVTRPTTAWVGGDALGDCGVRFQSVKSDITGVLREFSVVKCSVEHWDGGGWGKLVRWDVNSGAHGVTRTTTRGLAAMRWVIVGCGFKA